MSNSDDIFAETAFGKAALRKLGAVPENFQLYFAGWLGKMPKDWNEMLIKGRVFGKSRGGKLDVPMPGTIRRVVVTRDEILAELPVQVVKVAGMKFMPEQTL